VAWAGILVLLALVMAPLGAGGQTKVKPGMNFFSINDDISLGRQASMQVEQQMPMVNDPVVQRWADQFGRHLASYTTMPNLPWQFRVTNSAQVNAFALPGGFVYINRGLIEKTDRESELAGVIGHEMAHVTLRHGTNQLSKGLLAQAPLAMLGGMGGAGWAMSQVGGMGLSMAFLKFSRTDETQADVVGTQTMAKAGYDPQGMVTIFQKLQQIGAGRNTSEFLSDHPNPGNRIKRIEQEIGYLRVPASPVDSSPPYFEAKKHLRDLPFVGGSAPRPSGYGRPDSTSRPGGGYGNPGEPPSSRFETYRSSDGAFTVDYPSNWQSFANGDRSVTIGPEWAMEGSNLTRGAIVSYFDPRGPDRSRGDEGAGLDLDQALNTIIRQLKETNGYLREERGARYSGRLAGEQALATFLVGRTDQGVQERDWLIVRPSGQGIIYMLFVAPYSEFKQLQSTYQQMIRSFQMRDRGDR